MLREGRVALTLRMPSTSAARMLRVVLTVVLFSIDAVQEDSPDQADGTIGMWLRQVRIPRYVETRWMLT